MSFAPLNLAALPPPAALETWAFSAIVAAEMADFTARMVAAGVPYDVGALESDPARAVMETYAYREGLVRQRVNDAVLATSLANARGTDLDVVAANYGVIRATGELDPSVRLRAQLAWEALTLGGSYGGYRSKALNAAPTDLADVQVFGMETPGVGPGEVRIVCLGTNVSGLCSPAVLAAVRAAFPRGSRKVNDFIHVVSADPAPYSVDATIVLAQGADPALVVAAQTSALNSFASARRAIGGYVSLDSVAAVLGHDSAGLVYDVVIRSPLARVGGGPFQAPILTGARVLWSARS